MQTRRMLGVQQTFDDLGAPLHTVPFVVLDLETTGTSPGADAITEIGAVRYLGGELTGTFHTLIDPGTDIPPLITVLTGITSAMVIGAPRVEEALPSLLEFVGDGVIVGHNVRFDKGFLDAAARRLGYGPLPNRTADTCALSRRLLAEDVRDHRLATLAAHLRSPVTPTHRALDDARATAHVFFELLGRAGAIGVTYLEDLMRLPTARGAPHYAKLRLTDRLPRRPGVYLFRNAAGEVIYVGKAKELRSRVRSYFYGDRRRRITQMMRELTAVDHMVCPTEIDAAVTEIRLIDHHAPRYNRRSRPTGTAHWVRLTDERFPRLSVVRSQQGRALAHLGPFRRKSSAELAVTAIWDAAPIRRCIGSGGGPRCRFAQLGVAVCPCDGTVDPARYAAIVDTVLAGMTERPELLLEPLVERMRRLAASQRFEQAADVRDRYRALAAAVHTRQVWQALSAARLVWAEDPSGDAVAIDHGGLAAAWRRTDPAPLRAAGDLGDPFETPPTALAAEELRLLWRWLDRPGVTVVHSDAPLVLPPALPTDFRLAPGPTPPAPAT